MITVSRPVRNAIFMQIRFYLARASTRTVPSSIKISVAFKIPESQTFPFFASMVAEISVKNASKILLLISFAILFLFSQRNLVIVFLRNLTARNYPRSRSIHR